MSSLTLLGPQRVEPNVAEALTAAGIGDPLVSITAGWRDAEGEIAELSESLHRPVTDLNLYTRTEQIFAADPELLAAHEERQARLQELQHLYRIRLRHAVDALRELDRHEDTGPILLDQRRAALSQLRLVDRQHQRQIRAIHATSVARCDPDDRPRVRAERQAIADVLAPAAGVLIAGGHVAVLLNRLRLLGLDRLLGDKHVVAWSAGAMCLAAQVVLFHERAPEGRRDAEIMDLGLGLLPGVVPLPHAERRLRLDDASLCRVFARRFGPAACLTLDRGSLIRWRDGRLEAAKRVRRLTRGGGLRKAAPA